MRLTFLGTGSAMPVPDRAQSGLLVEVEGRRIVVDVGSGVLGRLAYPIDDDGKAADSPRRGYEAVDAVLLTHHHLDHVADLLPLCKARWLAGSEPLSLLGPPETDSLVEDLLATFPYLQDRFDLDIGAIAGGERRSIAGLTVEARRTEHSVPCLAYRLSPEDGSKSLVISGDSEADSGLATWADGADVLVHDCSFPSGVEVSNHPTPRALGEALAGSTFGTVYLTHLYPMADAQPEALVRDVRAAYDGTVEVARDGTTVEI